MQKTIARWWIVPTAVAVSVVADGMPALAENRETWVAGGMEQIIPAAQLSTPSTATVEESDRQGMGSGDAMSQVNSVFQLRDVSPGDWAFEALRNLVERYGCIAGYPDGTFRGDRPISRYEFAAGLNACMQAIERVLVSGEGTSRGTATPTPDRAALERLAQEFASELAIIGAKVDGLEARVTDIETTQFSTTTKLSGSIFFNITGAFASDDVLVETSDLSPPLELRPAARNSATGNPITRRVTDDPEVTFSDLVWLSLNTSFTGRDRLVTQLVAGNGVSPANEFASAGLFNTFGVPFTDQTAGPEVTGSRNQVVLRELFYSFPVGDRLQVVLGPRVNWYRYFDGNAYTFFLTGTSSFNSIGSTLTNTFDRGSGAVVLWDISEKFDLNIGYLAENTEFLPSAFGFNTASNPASGLFNATNSLTVELAFAPSSTANIRLLYNRSDIQANVPIFDENGNITGFGVGSADGEPIYGVADDGFGGSIENADADTFGVSFDWSLSPNFGIFARYGYASTDIDPVDPTRADGDVEAQSIQFGLAFPDLGKEGSLAALSFLIPYDVLDGDEFLASGGGDGGTQFEIEASYFYPVNRNIAIVPAVYVIGNPNNFEDNPTIIVGNLRTQFSF